MSSISEEFVSGVMGNLELEVDKRRGVLYLHSRDTGRTVLRVCRIPKELAEEFPTKKGKLVMDFSGDDLYIATEGGEIVALLENIPSPAGEGFWDVTLGYHPTNLLPGSRL